MSGGLSLSSLSLAFALDVRPRTQSPATEPQTPGDSQLPEGAPSPEKKLAEDTEQTAAKKDDKEMKHRALVVVPLLIVSPAIGSGIIPVAGYIFPFQEVAGVLLWAPTFTSNSCAILAGRFLYAAGSLPATRWSR
jgi:hypothetical protein